MFRKTLTMLFVALGLFAMPLGLAGCEAEEDELENDMQQIGEGLEDTAEDAEQELEEAME
jgi:hypothetical protein